MSEILKKYTKQIAMLCMLLFLGAQLYGGLHHFFKQHHGHVHTTAVSLEYTKANKGTSSVKQSVITIVDKTIEDCVFCSTTTYVNKLFFFINKAHVLFSNIRQYVCAIFYKIPVFGSFLLQYTSLRAPPAGL